MEKGSVVITRKRRDSRGAVKLFKKKTTIKGIGEHWF
jgi:hypothetical protein